MAIKGKSKGRSRRVVAAPPKPTQYVRKPPLIRRRWFLVAVAAVVIVSVFSAFFISTSNRHKEARKAHAIRAVNDFASRAENTFQGLGAGQPQPPTGYLVYPTLIGDLDSVAKGSKKIDGVKKGKNLEEAAKAAGEAIAKINVPKLVPEDADYSEAPGLRGPGATRLVVLEAQYLLEQSFALYEQVGGLMTEAAQSEGKDRAALVVRAKALATQAGALFRRGYQKIITLKAELGQLQRNPFPAPGTGGA